MFQTPLVMMIIILCWQLTVYGLIEKYESCAGRLRKTQIQRRILSLKSVLPINFSSEVHTSIYYICMRTYPSAHAHTCTQRMRGKMRHKQRGNSNLSLLYFMSHGWYDHYNFEHMHTHPHTHALHITHSLRIHIHIHYYTYTYTYTYNSNPIHN